MARSKKPKKPKKSRLSDDEKSALISSEQTFYFEGELVATDHQKAAAEKWIIEILSAHSNLAKWDRDWLIENIAEERRNVEPSGLSPAPVRPLIEYNNGRVVKYLPEQDAYDNYPADCMTGQCSHTFHKFSRNPEVLPWQTK